MKKIFYFSAILTISLGACKKDNTSNPNTSVADDIREIIVPESFKYATAKELSTTISVKDLNDLPLEGIRINFYDKDPLEGGEVFASGFTQNDGTLSSDIKIPSYLENVFVECNYKGFANTQLVPANDIAINFGGAPAVRKFKKSKTEGIQARIPLSGNVYYFGSFSSNGLPDYLENPGDVITSSLLADINATLPSGQNVVNSNPQYINASNEFDIVVDELSDVWMTFLTEGAGYKNSLAYYVFDSNNPPATVNDIDSLIILLPNASLAGAGGNLNAGDKVRLGRFPAGKTISWVLLQNAYSSSSNSVDVNATRLYSNSDFNPEPNASQRQHTVQFADNVRQLLVNGFEDLNRASSSLNPSGYPSDNDFEDLMFYITSNPWTGVDSDNSPPIETSNDNDNDGVNDDVDDYPNDPQRAVDLNYSGNIGFEDLWPSQGDYDFNDLVMKYDITHVMNGQNEVVDIDADWTIRAVGAGFKNGFGWEFNNVSPSAVSSVTGSSLSTGVITNASNGVESGQTYATVIAFDNVFNEIQHAGGAFINTVKADPTVPAVTKSMTINFSTPQNLNDVGLPPYNAFIFVDGDRTKEVHLSDERPTSLADQNLFGTIDDDSNVGQARYYKTNNNLPWAIHIYGDYDYPVEFTPIDDAHLNFSPWAQSGGTTLENWYLDEAGYRDASKIY